MKKRAFTFVELVVGITISTIVFLIVLTFLTDTFSKVLPESNKTYEVSNLLQIRDDIGGFIDDGYREVSIYSSGGTLPKVLFLKNVDSEKGAVMFGVVDNSTKKIETNSKFGKNHLGYRLFSPAEVLEVDGDNSKVYEKIFLDANFYPGLSFTKFAPKKFDSDKFLDIDLEFTTLILEDFYGKDISSLGERELSLEKYNLVY